MIARLRSLLADHRNALLLVAALACGAVAVQAGRSWLAHQLEAERARLAPVAPRTVAVVVARQDLAKGDVVDARTMAVRDIPEEFVSSSAVRPDRFDAVSGLRLAVALRGGEQLVASAIVGGDHMSFSQRVKPGIRALTIAVDEVNSISGMLQPGDRIDLLFSARLPERDGARGQGGETTLPLFQGLLVLATGRQVRAGVDERGAQRSYSTVTVEVAPEQAQRLVVAQRTGKLTAVLRNPDDPARMARQAMDLRQLLGVAPALAATEGPQVIIGGIGRVPVGTTSAAPEGLATPPAEAGRSGEGAGR